MHGQSPAWLRFLVTGLAASVLGYCLWTGKISRSRFGGTITRAKNPADYWIRILTLAVIFVVLLIESLSQ